jgi:hypothetical protein
MRPALIASLLVAIPACTGAAELDLSTIERATGLKPAWNEKERVAKVSAPRVDLDVRVGGIRLTPPMGLTSWAAFQATPAGAMVMGDLVLREQEVGAVMTTALDQDLAVTALHNHFIAESPRVFFMHIGGMGELDRLSAAVGRVFERIRQEAAAPMPAAKSVDTSAGKLDAPRIDALLGARGEVSGGVYKAVVAKPTRMHAAEVGAAMGANTWAAFAGTDANAVVDGDFAMRESELQPVLKALRGASIDVVAIHNHMTGESPRLVFLHYWGVGPAENLARGVRAALDAQDRASSRDGRQAASAPGDVGARRHS